MREKLPHFRDRLGNKFTRYRSIRQSYKLQKRNSSKLGFFSSAVTFPHYSRKKKTTFRTVVLLGEGIFTMGCSKNYIMYWGVFTLIIVPFSHSKVCTNFQKNSHSFYSICIVHKFEIENTAYFLHKTMAF